MLSNKVRSNLLIKDISHSLEQGIICGSPLWKTSNLHKFHAVISSIEQRNSATTTKALTGLPVLSKGSHFIHSVFAVRTWDASGARMISQ